MKFLQALIILGVVIEFALADHVCPDHSACTDIPSSNTINALQGYYYTYAINPFLWVPADHCGFIQFTNTTNNVINFEYTSGGSSAGVTYGQLIAQPDGTFTMDSYAFNSTIPTTFKVIALNSEYIISYTCFECGFYSQESAGPYYNIHTRLLNMPCKSVDSLRDKLAACGIPVDKLYFPDNSNCAFQCAR